VYTPDNRVQHYTSGVDGGGSGSCGTDGGHIMTFTLWVWRKILNYYNAV